MSKISVKINGKEEKIDKDASVRDLLNLKSVKGIFVVEKNLKIVDKDCYESEILNQGDEIEIVSFAGGG